MAPFPIFVTSGRTTPSQDASKIYSYYVSIAKLSDEVKTEPTVNVAKIAKLGFGSCRLFNLATASPPPDLVVAVRHCFDAEGLTWTTQAAMLSDITALRTQAQTFFVFVRDNVPEARTIATDTYDANGTETTQSATITKTQAISDQVNALRAMFV